jgi:putative membrane protein
MKMLAGLMLLGVGFWLTGVPAAADDEKESKGGEKEFVKKASACGLAEVNLSELAVRFARDPAVKQFAEQMIADHMRASRELTAMANRQQIAIKEMDDKHQKLFDKLKTLSGNEFDRQYMEAMVKDHEEAVKLFEQQSKDGTNEGMKQWAGRLTPILKRHLEHAQEVCKNVKEEKK